MIRRRDAAGPAAGTAALRRVERRRLAGWLGAVLGASVLALWLRLGPIPPIPRDTSPVIVDRNGVVLYEPLASNGTRSEWIKEVPENVARATIAAEDRRFERHVADPLAARPVGGQRLVEHHAAAVGDDRRRVARDGREGAEAEPEQQCHPERERGNGEGRAAPCTRHPPTPILRYAQDDTQPHG